MVILGRWNPLSRSSSSRNGPRSFDRSSLVGRQGMEMTVLFDILDGTHIRVVGSDLSETGQFGEFT